MKKIILFFSFLLMVLSPSITSHATMLKPPTELNPIFNPLPGATQGAPDVLLPATLDDVTQFAQGIPTYYFESQGLDLTGDSTFEDVVLAVDGVSPNTGMLWEHHPFTGVGAVGWLPFGNLYNENGQVVPVERAGICWGQNDYAYTMFLYDTETGEALRQGETFESSVSTIDAGVKDTFWDTCGRITGIYGPSEPISPLAIYNQHLATSQQIDYYNRLPNSAYWYDSLHDIGVFVADVQATSSVYVQGRSGSGWTVYYNDDGAVRTWNNWTGGGGWQNVKPQAGTFVLAGNSYSYRFPPQGYSFNTTDSKENFTNTNDPDEDEPDNPNNIVVIFYTPQEPFELPEIINREKQLKNPVNKHTEPNPNYNVNNNYSYYNFNFTTTTESPDVAPTYNYYEYIYNYYTTPEATPETELNPEELNTDVPILSNLRYRFPFSIPWDIHEMLSSLQAQRRAPHIEGDIVFPVINYTWHVDIDLSLFNSSAELFRKCFLVLFVVGLALYSYRHHFGA